MGVVYLKQTGKWEARVYVEKCTRYLGTFYSEQEASDAYQKALKQIENGQIPPVRIYTRIKSRNL